MSDQPETIAAPTGLVEAYLIEQQSLSAVDRFTQRHAGAANRSNRAIIAT